MRRMFRVGFPSVLLFILVVTASSTIAQTPTFTYQGRLTVGGTPANGPYDMEFKLYDALTLGNLQGSPNTVTKTGVTVTNGIFTVQLDFGPSAFPGADRYLDIGVKHPADASYTPLLPRQQLTSTPYAIRSSSAGSADTATTATNNVLKAGDTMTGALVLSGNPTTNLGAATKQYVDAGLASKLSLSGGTMSGPLDLGSNNITSLAAPTAGTDAANKDYVDAAVSGGGSGFQWQEITGTSHQAVSNRGYVANNTGEVTITLPATPNIGDVVRVSGAGLETSTWKIAQNEGQRILTPNFGVANATGIKNWFSAASSADGVKLVLSTESNQIFTSIDSGGTWALRPNGTGSYVASSSDGNNLVAVVNGGRVYTSADSGVNWTARDSVRNWRAVASSSDGSQLVAVVNGGQIYTSTDSGVNWFPRDSNRPWRSVASSADGSKLVAVVEFGQIYTSTDSGVNWFPRDSNRGWRSVASSSDGSKLVAVVPGGQIYTSIDSGANWTPRDSNRNWRSVASSADGTKLVAVVYSGQIYTSIDSGLNWTPRHVVDVYEAVASSADGSKLIVGPNPGKIQTSVNSGLSWTSPISSTTPGPDGFLRGGGLTAVELLYVGGGSFLPISYVNVASILGF